MTKLMRRALGGAVLLAVPALPALAELRWENATGGSTVAYGQFNPAFQGVDDGARSFSTIVDNGNSNSRVGLWIRQPYAGGKFAFNFETALGFRQSHLVSQGFTPDAINWDRVFLRKIDFSWASDSWGKISVGQGSMASDGAAEIDLSGTSLVGYSWIGGAAGAFRFTDAAGVPTTRAISAVMPNFDAGRRLRARYDSPSFSGFTVSVSYGEEILVRASDLEAANIALRYAGEAGAWKMRGAIAYNHIKPGGGAATRNDTIGSFSMLHGSGFNATLAAGNRDTSGRYAYGKLGYIANWFGAGSTAMSFDYYSGSDMLGIAGSDSNSVGVQAVQKFDNANLEAYLGWRDYSLSEPGTTYRDLSSILVGARWKF